MALNNDIVTNSSIRIQVLGSIFIIKNLIEFSITGFLVMVLNFESSLFVDIKPY